MTLKPFARSRLIALASRTRFARNLPVQKSMLDLGVVARLQPVWWCQKQPFTKIAHRRETFAKSGLPGRLLTLRRYRNLSVLRIEETIASGRVLVCLTRAIRSDAPGVGITRSCGFGGDFPTIVELIGFHGEEVFTKAILKARRKT